MRRRGHGKAVKKRGGDGVLVVAVARSLTPTRAGSTQWRDIPYARCREPATPCAAPMSDSPTLPRWRSRHVVLLMVARVDRDSCAYGLRHCIDSGRRSAIQIGRA